MKYDVKEDFPLDVGKPEPIEVKAGTVFIPAELNIATNVVDKLVKDGVLELIRPPKDASKQAKRK